MGMTSFEIEKLERVIGNYNPLSVCELGSQNLYLHGEETPPFSKDWYLGNGLKRYASIDLGGDNQSIKKDLSIPFELGDKFDLVTDFGTSEHVVITKGYVTVAFNKGHIHSVYPTEVEDVELGYYNCWLNKHNLLRIGGVMVNVNPLTGHWEGHGYNYLGEDFYEKFVKVSGYELIETGLNGATGNWETGVNVYGIIKKTSNQFPSFEVFKTLPIFKK